jgi:hypothetical protein
MATNRLALQPDMTSTKQPAAANSRSRRTTQRDRLYQLLYNHRNEYVGLPQILELKIAQFGARIKELRALGADIRNRRETKDGATHSWYKLVIPDANLEARDGQ